MQNSRVIREVEGKSSTVIEGKEKEMLMKIRESTVYNASNVEVFSHICFQIFLHINYVIHIWFSASVAMTRGNSVTLSVIRTLQFLSVCL